MANFDKYQTISPDYHYRRINRHSLREFSAPVVARFEDLVEKVTAVTKKQPLKLLDVGCGDGVALFLLNKRLPQLALFGVEPMPEAITVAREKVPQAQISQGTADQLPYEDSLFDIVISSDVIEHVENAEQMLLEIKRVAKVGAHVIIGTPVKLTKKPLDHNHIEEFFLEDFQAMLERHFSNVRIFETHNLAYMLFYNTPTRSFLNFKYLINLLVCIFGWNPFRKGRTNRIELFAYMTAVCQK